MPIIKIKGMSCGHCEAAVARVLSGIDGIRNVRVDLRKGEAFFDEEKPVDREIIRQKISKAGYEVV
ncbi:MAG: heavy-metal-associated domain-containing protein [Syntrophales bacterium]